MYLHLPLPHGTEFIMKIIGVIISFIVLLSCVFTLVAFAANETTSWGSQWMMNESKLANIDGDENSTTVHHNFDSVGYTYIHASCDKSDATFTTTIQKQGFLGIWSDKITGNAVMNSTAEWGLGGEFGSGKYRFWLNPYNTTVELGNGGIGYYIINIDQFFSKSSTQ